MAQHSKVIGIGLNKTGTKTLKRYLEGWGLRHRSFELDAFQLYRAGRIDELLQSMEPFDSFGDWPWPLIYREIDARFPDARFILTTRKDSETWFRSLCNMAVRMGPLDDFERHVYGHAMPQGQRRDHVEFYERHNSEVREHFAGRAGKLLELCWENGDTVEKLAAFLNLEAPDIGPVHVNRSPAVYTGDSLVLAHANRIVFQSLWRLREGVRWVVTRCLPRSSAQG